jgi:hypothetical protein
MLGILPLISGATIIAQDAPAAVFVLQFFGTHCQHQSNGDYPKDGKRHTPVHYKQHNAD